MKVIWLEQADEALSQTAAYIASEFGWNAMERFMAEVDQVGLLLADNPYMGPVEPLLVNRTSNYRSIVVGNLNKIVYRINNNRIEIADFWDTRREPKRQAENLE